MCRISPSLEYLMYMWQNLLSFFMAVNSSRMLISVFSLQWNSNVIFVFMPLTTTFQNLIFLMLFTVLDVEQQKQHQKSKKWKILKISAFRELPLERKICLEKINFNELNIFTKEILSSSEIIYEFIILH